MKIISKESYSESNVIEEIERYEKKMMSYIFSSCKTNIGDLCLRCVHPVIIEMVVERQGQGTTYHHSTG